MHWFKEKQIPVCLLMVLALSASPASADEGTETANGGHLPRTSAAPRFQLPAKSNTGPTHSTLHDSSANRELLPVANRQATAKQSKQPSLAGPSSPIAEKDERLRLPPPSKQASNKSEPSSRPTATRALSTVLGSLGVVVGLFLLVAWFTRKTLPKAAQHLPSEVVEVLGRTPLAARQSMQLIRVGKKMLLICVTANGAETLTEITDPEEVDRIAGVCQQKRSDSISTTFRQVISQMGSTSATKSEPDNATSERRTARRQSSRRSQTRLPVDTESTARTSG